MTASIKIIGASVRFPKYRYKLGAPLFQKMLGFGREEYSFNALDNLNVRLHSGDRLALIGRNGAGKSTFLKMAAGILPPHQGEVKISGRVFPALTPAPGVISKATCAQNIILQGLSYGLSGDDLKAYIVKVSEFSALGDFLNSPYESLSAGMKSRFSISTLNYVKPEILLMDEWVGAADKTVLNKDIGLLESLVSSSEIFILASHRKEILENYCNRALVFKEGKVIFDGSVQDALHFPDR